MKLPELITILRNAKEYSDINKYKDEIVELIPKTEIMVDYNQRNKAHQYDLWQHCCETVLNLPKDIDDDRVSLRMKHLRRHLRMGYTLQEFQNLMLLQVADAKAHILIPIIEQRIEICSQLAGEYGKELYQKLLFEDYIF